MDITQKFDEFVEKYEKANITLLEYLDDKFDQVPTKAYLDEKIAELEGKILTGDLKNEYRINRLTEILKKKGSLTEIDYETVIGIKKSS